nr:protein qua-1-like [Malus domestica]
MAMILLGMWGVGWGGQGAVLCSNWNRFDVKGYVTGFGSPDWARTRGEESGSLGKKKGGWSEWAPLRRGHYSEGGGDGNGGVGGGGGDGDSDGGGNGDGNDKSGDIMVVPIVECGGWGVKVTMVVGVAA